MVIQLSSKACHLQAEIDFLLDFCFFSFLMVLRDIVML